MLVESGPSAAQPRQEFTIDPAPDTLFGPKYAVVYDGFDAVEGSARITFKSDYDVLSGRIVGGPLTGSIRVTREGKLAGVEISLAEKWRSGSRQLAREEFEPFIDQHRRLLTAVAAKLPADGAAALGVVLRNFRLDLESQEGLVKAGFDFGAERLEHRPHRFDPRQETRVTLDRSNSTITLSPARGRLDEVSYGLRQEHHAAVHVDLRASTMRVRLAGLGETFRDATDTAEVQVALTSARPPESEPPVNWHPLRDLPISFQVPRTIKMDSPWMGTERVAPTERVEEIKALLAGSTVRVAYSGDTAPSLRVRLDEYGQATVFALDGQVLTALLAQSSRPGIENRSLSVSLAADGECSLFSNGLGLRFVKAVADIPGVELTIGGQKHTVTVTPEVDDYYSQLTITLHDEQNTRYEVSFQDVHGSAEHLHILRVNDTGTLGPFRPGMAAKFMLEIAADLRAALQDRPDLVPRMQAVFGSLGVFRMELSPDDQLGGELVRWDRLFGGGEEGVEAQGKKRRGEPLRRAVDYEAEEALRYNHDSDRQGSERRDSGAGPGDMAQKEFAWDVLNRLGARTATHNYADAVVHSAQPGVLFYEPQLDRSAFQVRLPGALERYQVTLNCQRGLLGVCFTPPIFAEIGGQTLPGAGPIVASSYAQFKVLDRPLEDVRIASVFDKRAGEPVTEIPGITIEKLEAAIRKELASRAEFTNLGDCAIAFHAPGGISDMRDFRTGYRDIPGMLAAAEDGGLFMLPPPVVNDLFRLIDRVERAASAARKKG